MTTTKIRHTLGAMNDEVDALQAELKAAQQAQKESYARLVDTKELLKDEVSAAMTSLSEATRRYFNKRDEYAKTLAKTTMQLRVDTRVRIAVMDWCGISRDATAADLGPHISTAVDAAVTRIASLAAGRCPEVMTLKEEAKVLKQESLSAQTRFDRVNAPIHEALGAHSINQDVVKRLKKKLALATPKQASRHLRELLRPEEISAVLGKLSTIKRCSDEYALNIFLDAEGASA